MANPIDNKTKRQSAFLQRLTDAKERLQASIEGLDETTICTQPVIGEWTIKDILGHIVTWNEEFRANILMILQDELPGTITKSAEKAIFVPGISHRSTKNTTGLLRKYSLM